jgi:NAD(P)-dependent dehydrogenase (short-subunit alcohol dehydrogenase family)
LLLFKVVSVINKHALIIGGSSGTGYAIAEALARRGEAVTLTSRSAETAGQVAARLGTQHRGIALDLTAPEGIASALAGIGQVDHLVLVAVERDRNSVRGFDIASAIRAITLKTVGYTAVVAALSDRLAPDAAIVMFGGIAFSKPYPGSTTITQANGAVNGLVRTLAVELAPIRVNAIHPGAIGDTPEFQGVPGKIEFATARTPTARLPTMADMVAATEFLLDNGGVNAVNLAVDGGYSLS